ncbi:D-aminoacyl-tRNA deacylase [Neisseria sp. 23W00296]|uniref:D-aminoacyl-tRNA deacylase n=1 Tax=unclassified Neisseria TaxID=2623750 RepID=UPI0002A3CB54|nr:MULTISPECIES: D-aminoacyl-tRNA deacylase [unclassified Neisseria]ASP17029.1 D-tyrosyl-tRNA(Tyr) deacylase [Neisseria sp. KEM232]EKY06429.1 D-tyrosyl-tRNA(Tyr) deacylase [Neisseria sp. oral taxon 020 str. F0370]
MRAVIQKVTRAEVGIVHGGGCETVGQISDGLLVLLGVGQDDGEDDARYIADKTAGLRIFEDEAGKLNLSLRETGGAVLLVSQFTLHGDARSGRRPSFSAAAKPDEAERLYLLTAQMLRDRGIRVETGRFRTHMQVSLCNDGPVTLLLDSKKLF